MSTYRLTQKQKRTWLPLLELFYFGGAHLCFYCANPIREDIKGMGREFDHLNNKEYDNRVENVVPCHAMCNDRKKWDMDYIMIAKEQLKLNEKNGVIKQMGEREKNTTTHNQEQEEKNTRKENEEIYSNSEFTKITTEYLAENLSIVDRIPYKSSIDSITLKCFNEVGHGSQNTIRRVVDMLASTPGKYEVVRDGGKRWIQKRNNEMITP